MSETKNLQGQCNPIVFLQIKVYPMWNWHFENSWVCSNLPQFNIRNNIDIKQKTISVHVKILLTYLQYNIVLSSWHFSNSSLISHSLEDYNCIFNPIKYNLIYALLGSIEKWTLSNIIWFIVLKVARTTTQSVLPQSKKNVKNKIRKCRIWVTKNMIFFVVSFFYDHKDLPSFCI